MLFELLFVGLVGFVFLLRWLFWPVIETARANKKTKSAKDVLLGLENRELEKPSISDEPSILLSLIVPAYNEEDRLPVMLDETMAFLGKWQERFQDLTFEVVVVDDGSKDRTTEVALSYAETYGDDVLRVLKLGMNRGKGGAVTQGMLVGRGEYLLMVDGDGATAAHEIGQLFDIFQEAERGAEGEGGRDSFRVVEKQGVIFGSRAHLEKDSIAKRSFIRTVLMKGFHFLVLMLTGNTNIQDTQCGFKMFTRKAADRVFHSLHLERWAFDIEILYLCSVFHIPIKEKGVEWQEIEGSKLINTKLDLIFTSLAMARDMLCVRLAYLLGIWKANGWRADL